MKTDDPDRREFTLNPWKHIRRELEDGEEVRLNHEETVRLFGADKSVDVRTEGVKRYKTTEGGPPELLRLSHVADFRAAVKLSVENLAGSAFLAPGVLSEIEDSSREASADQRSNIVAALGNDLTEADVFPVDEEGGPPVRRDALISSGDAAAPTMTTRADVAGDLERYAAEKGLTELAAIEHRLKLANLRANVDRADRALKKPRKWKLKRGSSTRHGSQMHMSDAEYAAEQRRLRPGGS